MSIVQLHEELSSKIRISLIFFIFLIILDSSTLFDIPISDTYIVSSNLSTWLSSLIIGIGYIDSFSFNTVGIYLMLICLLFGVIKSPFRNIWALEFTIACTFIVICFSNYRLIGDSITSAVGLNFIFQSIKLIPLFLALYWTKKLALPNLI